jgi:hypothetical protein
MYGAATEAAEKERTLLALGYAPGGSRVQATLQLALSEDVRAQVGRSHVTWPAAGKLASELSARRESMQASRTKRSVCMAWRLPHCSALPAARCTGCAPGDCERGAQRGPQRGAAHLDLAAAAPPGVDGKAWG